MEFYEIASWRELIYCYFIRIISKNDLVIFQFMNISEENITVWNDSISYCFKLFYSILFIFINLESFFFISWYSRVRSIWVQETCKNIDISSDFEWMFNFIFCSTSIFKCNLINLNCSILMSCKQVFDSFYFTIEERKLSWFWSAINLWFFLSFRIPMMDIATLCW